MVQVEPRYVRVILRDAFIGVCLAVLFTGPSAAQSNSCFEHLHRNQPKDADYYFDLRFDKSAIGDRSPVILISAPQMRGER